VIEKDTTGRFTITIKVVEEADQAEWMAKVNNDVISKCMVYVEEPRDAFGMFSAVDMPHPQPSLANR